MAGQPKGLMAFRDELAGLLGSFDKYGGSGERAFWLEAYGGRPYVNDRVKHAGKPLTIPHLTISIVGGLQPDKLVSALMSGDDDGFAARFLLTWPEPVAPCRPQSAANDAAALEAMRRLMALQMVPDPNGTNGTNGALIPIVLPLTEEAATLFEEWRQDHAAASEAVTGMLEGHYGKMPGLYLRLALTLEHLWWCKSPVSEPPQNISKKAAAAAAALLNSYFAPMAERAYGDAAMPEADRLAARLARWIVKEKCQTINARLVRRIARIPGLNEAAKVKLAVSALEEVDWLSPSPTRDGGNPGRQKDDYAVNPKIWEALQ